VTPPNIKPLDSTSPTPLYHQLKEQLRQMAQSMPAGAPMPSETDLVELTGVSRATIRRAVADLTYEGLLRSKRGLGTFVAQKPVDEPMLAIKSFTEIVASLGRTPSTKVLSFAKLRAPTDVAERLALPPRAPVFALERLRLVDGTPCMVERQFLSANLVPGLTAEDAAGSIYAALEGQFGVRLVDGVETIQAVSAPVEIAKHLQIARGAPLLLTARITFTQSGQPVEFVARYVRADMWSFTFRLARFAGQELAPLPVPVKPMQDVMISESLPSQQ